MHVIDFSDYKTGFGGKFGVQTDHMDKSALSWDHHEKLNKHESQVATFTGDLNAGIYQFGVGILPFEYRTNILLGTVWNRQLLYVAVL